MPPSEPEKSLLSEFFAPELRAWRGQISLAIVFWLYGVLTSLVLVMLHASALESEQLHLQQILIIVTALYTVWILVAIWRCAINASPFWGSLARWLTVAWGLNTGFVLLFLQIELMLRYAEG